MIDAHQALELTETARLHKKKRRQLEADTDFLLEVIGAQVTSSAQLGFSKVCICIDEEFSTDMEGRFGHPGDKLLLRDSVIEALNSLEYTVTIIPVNKMEIEVAWGGKRSC